MNCLFCSIGKNEIEAYTVFENEFVKCFLDINPKSNGHTLVIPKKHFKDMYDIENEYIIHISNAVKHLLNLYDMVLMPDGYEILQNNKELQEIKHFHTHIIPYYKDENNKIEDVKNVFDKIQKVC